VWQAHINGEPAVKRTQHVDIVIQELLKRRPTLIIVCNRVQTVEAGNLAPRDTDQLCGVIKLSRRTKHTPKKVGDVGNRTPILTQLDARPPDGRSDALPSISICTQHDGNGSSYST
jgi:hypothetical protein